MEKKVRNTIISVVVAGAVGFGAGTLLGIVEHNMNDKSDKYFNPKPYEYLLRDSENFGADMDIAFNSSNGKYDKPVRLKFRDKIPVIVDCNENLDEREVKIVQDIVKYYNSIFSSINENYSFAIKTDETEISENDTVISVSNGVVGEADDLTYGNARKSFATNGERAGFILSANITIDWDEIKNEDDLFVYGVLLHEFAHCLGLGDVYFFEQDNQSACIDLSTMMNVGNEQVGVLYPNDYAIFQVLYSNEYRKHENYEDAVKVVNEKIERYTKAFYKQYAAYLKESFDATGDLADADFFEELEWGGKYFSDSKKKMTLKFKENSKCDFAITDEKGEILETCEGKVFFADGILFVKNLVLTNGHNYSVMHKDGVPMKMMLSIYIDNNGDLVVRNSEYDKTTIKSVVEKQEKGKSL